MPRIAVVLTTINVPSVLSEYAINAQKYEQMDILYVVVGDLKSPSSTYDYIEKFAQSGQEAVYLGPSEQETWLKKHPHLAAWLPWNSVQRRNIGYLVATERGADVIISIDDDNFPLHDYNYFGLHSTVGSTWSGPACISSTRWFDSCSLLTNEPPRRVYHRGFPMNQRWQSESLSKEHVEGRMAVRVGLWLEDPDVDTVTRLEEPLIVKNVTEPLQELAFAHGTWGPFNSQNTSFAVDLLPAMFLLTLKTSPGSVLKGNNNFRYDDIWMSYFLKAILDHLGQFVVIGPPHVRQERNPHDFLLDLEKELLPMLWTQHFPKLLPSLTFKQVDPFSCYVELADQLVARGIDAGFPPPDLAVLKECVEGMRVWLESVERIQKAKLGC